MKKTNDYGRDSIPLLVLKTSVPFMLAQLVNVLYSIVDRIYVGNIPVIGADSLAGAGVCAPIITLLSSFGTLVGIGGSVLFPCVWEQGTKERAAYPGKQFFYAADPVGSADGCVSADQESAAELVWCQ